MEALFWISAAVTTYVYVGYPMVLAVWAALARWRQTAAASSGENGRPPAHAWPGVSVIIAARDEAGRLPARLDNILASDYPRDRLEIIIASDGSSDGTVEALAPYAGDITLLLLPPRGKAGALNAAVSEATHPLLVFTDARQRFAADAIGRLVSHFGDPTIGAVSGELVLEPGTSTVGDGVGLYWTYEKWLRRHEAIVGSTIGVTGAIYAMRRRLWRPLPPDTILDDVLAPMQVVLDGFRVTFDGQAHAYDEPAADAGAELRRKSRTLAGNYQLLAREPRLLLPFVNPVWMQFVSHKVGRLVVPWALLAMLGASAWLASASPLYALALAGQVAFYGLAAYGALLDRRKRRQPAKVREVVREAA